MKDLPRFVFLALLAVLPAFPSQADTWRGFLRLEGVPGGSVDSNHLGWIEFSRVRLGGVSRESATAAPITSQLCVMKDLDAASPHLALACAVGKSLPTATLDLTRADNSHAIFLRLDLTHVLVTSVRQAADGKPSAEGSEEVCLQAQVASWTFTRFRDDTGLAAAYSSSVWDLATRTGSAANRVPAYTTGGIRQANGVELSWPAKAGRAYRLYAVPDLTCPFVAAGQVTAPETGLMRHAFSPDTPAAFYMVEELPESLTLLPP